MSETDLGVMDYIICLSVLSISAAIGFYFGCFGTKQKSASEYMFGESRNRSIPIGLSIYSSTVSALVIVGVPIEIYTFGTQFTLFYVGSMFSILLAWFFVIPVFCGLLKINTPYEYFELRFNYSVRVLLTVIHVLDMLVFIPAVLFAATIVFSEAANISSFICTTVIGGICILYTLMGGFSAVIWTDTFQATLMLVSSMFVLYKAVTNVGGLSEMWQRAEQGERINFFILDINPFRRLTLWSAVFGGMINISGHCYCSASCIQRYLALKKEKSGRISTVIGSTLLTLFGFIICLLGLAMYAQYHDCDPIINKEVSGSNKLLPHFIAHTVRDIPGLLGLYNAGLISAGLSTMSAELNTVSALIYHCFIKKYWKNTNNEEEGAKIMKFVVLVYGALCLLITPLLDKAKYIFSLILGVSGITFGLKFGLVILGTTFPRTNSKGAVCGIITASVILIWLQIGSIAYNVAAIEVLPVSAENCESANVTKIALLMNNVEQPLFIYKLSFMYYSATAALITIIISLITSYITGPNDIDEMDPHLFIPCVRPKIEQTRNHEIEMLNRNYNF